MWLNLENLYSNNGYFQIFGKALLLSQKYEKTCKEIINWFKTTEVLIVDKYDFYSEEYQDYCDKLIKISLGRSIESLKKENKLIKIKEDDINILTAAKDSRNWIVHELCEDRIISNLLLTNDKNCIPNNFDHHITNLIEGDYLVSKWSYEFHEKESAYFFNKKEYIKNIKKWIFLTELTD